MQQNNKNKQIKIKLRRGDKVRVISGKYKGVEGLITKIYPEAYKATIEGITKVKHVKPTQQETVGSIKDVPYALSIQKIALIDPKNKNRTTKIGYRIDEKSKNKIRVARKSKANIG